MSYSLINALVVAQAAPVLPVAPAASAASVPPAAPDMGFMHFVAQSDSVGKALFVALILMSAVSWYFIFVKSASNYRMRRRSADFLNKFWNASSLAQVENEIQTHGAGDPLDRTIDVTISRLRAKLAQALPADRQPITTVRNIGYVFSADVHDA